jgi:hypothetical protein
MPQLPNWTHPCTAVIFLMFCFMVSPGGETRNRAAGSSQTNGSQSAAVIHAVQNHFGTAVEPVTAFQPFNVVGDFNGDGVEDAAIVVRIKERRTALSRNVRLLNPFESRGAIKFPTNPGAQNELGLAILHSWKSAKAPGKFLLIGESPILILQYSRATSSEQGDRQNLIDLRIRRSKARPAGALPRGSRGDVILLATEVGADSLLYWNGRTYLWEDAAED